MIKKISALVLALVLCLSVVVMPVNAAVELGSASIAFSLEWDKESYSAGDTAVLSIYMDAKDELSLATGSFIIGLSSSVFDPAVHTTDYLRANSTTDETFNSYYKAGDTNFSYLADTVAAQVNAANTAEEQALYDWYVKFTAAKNTAGSHPSVSTTKEGFYGSDFDPETPILTLSLTVKDDVEDGTKVNAAITTGSITKKQTAWKYYTNPGNSTSAGNITADTTSGFNIAAADTTKTTGDVVIGGAGLAVSYWKDQIRFQADDAGKYANKFDYRILATIDGFADIFDNVADAQDATDGDGILEAGFIFSKTGVVNKDTAIAQINGGTATYSAVTNAYVSTSFDGKEYVMACYVGGIADADVDASLSALGYVKYVDGGETKVATFDAAQTSTFRTLYDKNASNKPA